MILNNKVAIITGASMGIGKAIASAFAGEGAHLVICSRTEEELANTAKELHDSFAVRVEPVITDVSNPEQVKRLVDFTLDKFGTIDILVNNAGVYGPIGPVIDSDSEEWIECININLCGTFLTVQAVLPTMINKGSGKIVLLSGGGAVSPFPRFTAYGASKAGVVRFTETVSEEVKGHHIDINAIAPGPVNTRLLDQALAAGDAVGEEFKIKSIRQKQEGGVPPENIAELVVFLSSHQSDGLSGRLISLLWDNWQEIPEHLKDIMSSDVFTMRRIVPSDRGYGW